MSPTARTLLLGVALPFLPGCAAEDPERSAEEDEREGPRVVVVDETETDVVAPVRDTALTARAAEVVPLSGVLGVLWRPSGGFAVLNAGAYQVVWYEPSGALQTTHGRQGEGPGEYSDPVGMWSAPAGELVVLDSELGRVTTYREPGVVGGVRSIVGFRKGMNVRVLGWSDSLVLISEEEVGFGRAMRTGEDRDSTHFFVYRSGEGDFAEFSSIAGWRLTSDGSGVSIERPRLRTAYAGHGNRLFVSPGDEWVIRVIDPRGRFVRRIDFREDDDGAGGAAAQDEVDRRLFVDERDRIWTVGFLGLGPNGESGNTRIWSVLDTDGEVLFRVPLPALFRPFDLSGDRLIGVTRDAFGVERIDVFRVGVR